MSVYQLAGDANLRTVTNPKDGLSMVIVLKFKNILGWINEEKFLIFGKPPLVLHTQRILEHPFEASQGGRGQLGF